MAGQWRYYNHAMLPATPPHEDADLAPVNDGTIWRMGGAPLLARWTTDFDCGYETGWYYCIKDTPFCLDGIKSKYRSEINRGRRNFSVRRIDPKEHIREIWNIQTEAFRAYPREYRPHSIDYGKIEEEIHSGWDDRICFGAFEGATGELVSYSTFIRQESYIIFSALKTIPQYEKDRVNAAIIAYSLEYFNEDIRNGMYICDGERNISHQTNFQDYLERTFGFRKAYCRVHVKYRPMVRIVVGILYPVRGWIAHLPGRVLHNVNAVLKMEEICRNQV